MITEEDGFQDKEELQIYSQKIFDFWKLCEEQNIPLSEYETKTYSYIKETNPTFTYAQYQRTLHLYFPEESLTEFTNKEVYEKLQLAYIAYPNNIKQFALMANISKKMASVYIKYWGANGNKFSDDILKKFNRYYQSYLNSEISLIEFSKKVFGMGYGGQLLLLHMKENYLISRYHYKSCKEKSKRRNITFDITGDYINQIFESQNRRCAVTNAHLCSFYTKRHASSKFVYSIDRIDNDLGYVIGNIRLVTKTANMCRWTYTIEDHNELSILHVCNMIRNNEEAKKLVDPEVLEKLLLKSNKQITKIINPTFDVNKEKTKKLLSTNDISLNQNEKGYVYYTE